MLPWVGKKRTRRPLDFQKGLVWILNDWNRNLEMDIYIYMYTYHTQIFFWEPWRIGAHAFQFRTLFFDDYWSFPTKNGKILLCKTLVQNSLAKSSKHRMALWASSKNFIFCGTWTLVAVGVWRRCAGALCGILRGGVWALLLPWKFQGAEFVGASWGKRNSSQVWILKMYQNPRNSWHTVFVVQKSHSQPPGMS